MLETFKILAAAEDAKISASQINLPTVNPGDAIANMLNAAYVVAGVVAVIVIIIAGYSMTVSGSNASNVEKARNWILYASIGLVVIILAFAITNFLIGTF